MKPKPEEMEFLFGPIASALTRSNGAGEESRRSLVVVGGAIAG